VLGSFSSILGFLLAFGIHAVLSFYHFLCDAFLLLPNSIVTIGQPSFLKMLIFYTFVFLYVLMYYWKKGKWSVLFCIGCSILFLQFPSHTLQITMLDVGQGDGILIQSPTGTNYFIDGGSTSVNELEQYRISPCLKSKGIACIDYAIITHMDEDHISGITSLLEKTNTPGAIQIKTLIVPNTTLRDEAFETVVQLAKQQNVTVMYFEKGDKLMDGELHFTCMHPYEGFTTQERNDYSTVLYMEYRHFSMLFTGDVANEGEQALIDNETLPECDIYKAAHHGSKYTNSDALLDKVNAKFTIVSAGKDNDYGHPHQEVLQRLSDRNCACFCTIDYGALQIVSDGAKTIVNGFRNGTSQLFPKKITLGILQ
ncbi:MAG: MBL fold metallo-hydrolase, partial [bacterium]|nr:MBL fold metallo-hydrolase [bacterium]